MRQLVRFLTGHFASHNSPTRERREARFAVTPGNQNPGDAQNPLEATSENTLEQRKKNLGPEKATETVTGIMEQATSAMNVVGGTELLGPETLFHVYNSREILDVLLNDIESKELLRLAQITGIPIKDPRIAKDVVPIADQILGIIDNIPDKQRQSFIQRLLINRPRLLLRCAWELKRRVKQYSDLTGSIENYFTIDEKIASLEERIIAADDAKDEQMLEALENEVKSFVRQSAKDHAAVIDETLSRYFQWLEESRKEEMIRAGRDIRSDRSWYLSEEEKKNKRIDIMLQITRNAQKKFRAKANFGGKLALVPDGYVDRLRKEEEAMRTFLDGQVREQAMRVAERSVNRVTQLLIALNLPYCRSLQEAQTILAKGSNDESVTQARELDSTFLEVHGISLVPLLKDLDKTILEAIRQNRIPASEHAEPEGRYVLPPSIDDLAYLEYIVYDIESWQQREKELESDLGELQREQQEVEEWAHKTAADIAPLRNSPDWNQRLLEILDVNGVPKDEQQDEAEKMTRSADAILLYAPAKTPEERARLRSDLAVCVTAGGYPPAIRDNITGMVGIFKQPKVLEQMLAEKRKADERMTESANRPIDQIIEQTRSRLDAAIGAMIPIRANKDANDQRIRRDYAKPLTHTVSTFLKIAGWLCGKQTQLHQHLEAAKTDTDHRRARTAVDRIQSEVERIESCKRMLDEIESKTVERDDMDATVLAAYDPVTHTITMNRFRKNDPDVGQTLEHERGHAILDIFTHRSGLFPFLIPKTFEMYRGELLEEGKAFEVVLLSLTDHPSYAYIGTQNLSNKQLREELTEELLMRFSEWQRENEKPRVGNRMVFDPREEQLFRTLESGIRSTAQGGKRDQNVIDEIHAIGTFDAYHPIEKHRTEGTRPEDEEFNMKESLSEIERGLRNVKQFLVAYENKHSKFPRELWEELNAQYKSAENPYKELEQRFITSVKRGISRPEANASDIKLCKKLRDYTLDHLEKFVHGYDAERLDTTKEDREPGMLEKIFGGIEFVSFYDLAKLWQNFAEDWKSIYQRRQDKVLKSVGYAITKPLQDSKLLKATHIPWLSHYLPGLHAYHQRRYSNTDVEAADKWKDGMKNEGSHTLLHFLSYTKDRDAVRGIISLLCERGEMDWNNPGVWDTLSFLSGYTMPKKPCSRSDVLRDTWLRKMTSYIWTDKELYYHWRSENDSKIKSGKEGFTAWVDQLSNVHGGMESELRKQLTLWAEWKSETGDPPEDIKPHLYEKIIQYAIENGKMTMETKFYYLIRGVASGLLSIDRLRALAGQEGGVLNQFPFIDYFYKKNNSLPEIQALARRLTEYDEQNRDTFKPGVNTTIWIQLELVRNKGVQERLSKGTSRTSAEEIDHEDVPLFLPQLDYNGVREMANVISGSRQKMSPEARKNLYCGYSSKFKVFARLAELEEDGLERFTVEDANILSDAIGAYVDVDNIFTRRGYELEARPTLSKSQFLQKPVSGDSKHVTMDYRRNMNRFIARLVRKLYSELERSSAWEKFKDRYKREEEKLNPDGSVRRAAVPFKLEDYVRFDPDDLSSEKKDVAEKLFNATPFFVNALKEVLPKHVNVLKETLREFVDAPQDSDEQKERCFFDEGGSAADGGITRRRAREAIEARKRQREEVEQREATAY